MWNPIKSFKSNKSNRPAHNTKPVSTPLFEELEGRSMFSVAPSPLADLAPGHSRPAAVASSSHKSITLIDQATGLRLVAPRSYTLTQNNGVYTLSNGVVYAKLMLAKTNMSVANTRDSFIKASGITHAKLHGTKKSAVSLTGYLKGNPVTVTFTLLGKGVVDITTFGHMPVKSASVKRATTAAPALTANDIATLQNILATRRGGAGVPLGGTVPMKKFVAPDGGSSALVPDLAGWTYSGGGGVVSGANVTQGVFDLGVPVIVSLPGVPGSAGPIGNPQGPDSAIVNIWPQYIRYYYGANVQVLNVQAIPGTQGVLGANFNSGAFAIRFAFNGMAWQGLMSAGTFSTGSTLGWGFYYSYIAVPEGSGTGIGAALMQTWSSWDASGAAATRLAQALKTLLSIRVPGAPIDPDVFQEAADKWDAYIRE